jgi:hypothetical protein
MCVYGRGYGCGITSIYLTSVQFSEKQESYLSCLIYMKSPNSIVDVLWLIVLVILVLVVYCYEFLIAFIIYACNIDISNEESEISPDAV